MSFEKSVFFATVMTMLDELNSQEESKPVTNSNLPFSDDGMSTKITYNAQLAKNKLCQIAQDVFDKANDVYDTDNRICAAGIIPTLINDVIYESVSTIDTDDNTKEAIYNFAVDYCTVDNALTWDELHIDDGQLANSLQELTTSCMDTLLAAAIKINMADAHVDFMRVFVELMLHMEHEIDEIFAFPKVKARAPVIVIERAIAAGEKEIKRMEEDDPTVKGSSSPSEESQTLDRLYKNARAELNNENMSSAAAYYREILKINPTDWEAMFYSTFCAAYRTPYEANAREITSLAAMVAQCAPSAIRQAKYKLLARMDVLTELGLVATRTCKLGSNFFIASMNAFNASSGSSVATTCKTLEVSSIIKMIFAVGDSIEENFGDDIEIVKNLACNCWEIGFTCYENCDMPAPPQMYDHYLKMLKYNPSFRCSKPLQSNNSDGCYIATAVYGSYDCPQVWTLRRFRDYKLAQNIFGRAFIKFYYATSPTFVRWFKHTKWFNTIFRNLLDKFTVRLKTNGYEDTPYGDGWANK